MLAKLKRKFILINMLLVSVVLIVVFVSLIVSTYENRRAETMQALKIAMERGFDPEQPFDKPVIGGGGPGAGKQDEPKFNSTLTFCVKLDAGGRVIDTYAKNATVTEETVAAAVEAVSGSEDDTGMINALSLRWLRVQTPMGTKIAFADTEYETVVMRKLVISSLIIGALALVAFYFVSLFLSNVAIKPVEKSWEQQKRFVADASHELKTPLTIIFANTDILLAHRGDTVSGQLKWVENTREEASRMKRLVDDLLWLAKSDDARSLDERRDFSLSDVVLNCILQFESVAFDANVTFSSDVDEGILLCSSESRVRQLLGILLENACKYAGEGGRVSVSLKKAAEGAALTVNNTGAPIPSSDLPHIFERFYRSDRSRGRQTGGFGLGLAIAKTICDNLGFEIEAASTEIEGTAFTVRFSSLPGSSKRRRISEDA